MEAFRSLVVRYQRKVYAVALGIVRDADLAWDVSQDVFVRVHRSLDGFKGDSSFFTWLFRIATHVSIDSVRKERVAQRDEVDDLREADLVDAGEGILATALGNDPSETLLRHELASKMAAALALLPEKHRTILVLREVEGLSYEELVGTARDPQGDGDEPPLSRAEEDAGRAAVVHRARAAPCGGWHRG